MGVGASLWLLLASRQPGEVKTGRGLCRLLVRFVDWFAAIHDYRFSGCAFGWRAPDQFRNCLSYIV